MSGMLMGGSIGFVLGLMNGLFAMSNRILDSSLQMIRNIPHLALIPLVIRWFGIGEQGKLFLIIPGVFFPIYLNTMHGIRFDRSSVAGNGKGLWAQPLGPADACHPARRPAFDPSRVTFRVTNHVAHTDRG